MSAGNPLKIEYENAVKKFLDKNENHPLPLFLIPEIMSPFPVIK